MTTPVKIISIISISYLLFSLSVEGQPNDFGPAPLGQQQQQTRAGQRERGHFPGPDQKGGQQQGREQHGGPPGFAAMQRGSEDQGDRRLMQLLKTLIELDLSIDQKRQVATLVRDNRDRTLRSKQHDVQSARTELQQVSQAEVIDDKALDAAADKLGNAERDLALARAQLYQGVRAILNDTQRARLDQRREQLRKQSEQRANSVQELIDLWSSQGTGA